MVAFEDGQCLLEEFYLAELFGVFGFDTKFGALEVLLPALFGKKKHTRAGRWLIAWTRRYCPCRRSASRCAGLWDRCRSLQF